MLLLLLRSEAGAGAITGDAAITFGALTLSSVGALSIKADAAVTLDSLSLSAEGFIVAPISGEAAITLGDMTLVAASAPASGSKSGGVDPYYYKKRKKKQPEPVSKNFGDDWKPPVPRAALPPPISAQEILTRQTAAMAKTQTQLATALEELARRQAEADQEDEDEVALLLLAA